MPPKSPKKLQDPLKCDSADGEPSQEAWTRDSADREPNQEARTCDSADREAKNTDQTRAMIQAGTIIDRLTAYVNGEVELSASQVSAAKTLLNKVLPDLSAQKPVADDEGGVPQTVQVVERVERIIVQPK